ncbi:hypothetical protein GA830_12690 [Mesorhizobium sp. NBSH29]|uniref:hypothetical protein n=1 Tax=Mesorhizobium sp. NBSH29 TaxID=2654249 RepID=UPI00189642E2|nr:hypothetical protein [Mesorhizobium sp. NBSH29]QPC87506.1 hypothetical protein GA830_12690 [Mesorhizobium sp. NBSH29]
MARSRDPAMIELARRSKAHRARMMGCLAGCPVVQVKDLWVEAGLDLDRYADDVYMQVHHAERLLNLGYRPVVIPAMSGAANVLIFVREPWALDAHAGAVHPRLRP